MSRRAQASLFVVVCSLVVVVGCVHTPEPALPPVPVLPSSISLPAGSTLALITADPIDSNHARSGDVFAAVVSRDLNAGSADTPLLPSGSPARLTLQGGGSQWELGLSALMINGDTYMVTAENTNGTPSVILGEPIAAVPGTKRGKAENSNASGENHLAANGNRVWIPNGTLLTFRLKQSVQLVGTPRPRS